MDVYIEYVIVDNMVFNALLLYATVITRKKSPCWWRILLSSILGTICAMAMPFVELPTILVFIIKVAVAPIMIMLLYRQTTFLEIVWSTLIFIAYTFVLGGSIFALAFLTGTTIQGLMLVYTSKLPLGIFVSGIAIAGYIGYNLTQYIKSQRNIREYIVSLTITIGEESIELKGFIDSGNTLICDGYPVCFATDKKLSQLVRRQIADNVLSGRKIYQIEYKTISNSSTAVGILATTNANKQIILTPSLRQANDYQILLNGSMEGDYAKNSGTHTTNSAS